MSKKFTITTFLILASLGLVVSGCVKKPQAVNSNTDTSGGKVLLDFVKNKLGTDYEIWVNAEDINSDGFNETVAVVGKKEKNIIEKAIVISVRNEKPIIIFYLDSFGMKNEKDELIIPQLENKNGYIFEIGNYKNEKVYNNPVKIFRLTMADELGKGISDTLVVYWDPAKKAFLATNIFNQVFN